MSYTHLTKTELVFIEEYHEIGLSGRKIAKKLTRGHEAIYRVIRQLNKGLNAIDIYRQYKKNKAKCGRKRIILPPDEKEYINKKFQQSINTSFKFAMKSVIIFPTFIKNNR